MISSIQTISPEKDPEQFVEGAEPWAGPFGMNSQQLLAQGEVLEDEVICRAKDGKNPAEQISTHTNIRES